MALMSMLQTIATASYNYVHLRNYSYVAIAIIIIYKLLF